MVGEPAISHVLSVGQVPEHPSLARSAPGPTEVASRCLQDERRVEERGAFRKRGAQRNISLEEEDKCIRTGWQAEGKAGGGVQGSSSEKRVGILGHFHTWCCLGRQAESMT